MTGEYTREDNFSEVQGVGSADVQRFLEIIKAALSAVDKIFSDVFIVLKRLGKVFSPFEMMLEVPPIPWKYYGCSFREASRNVG